MEKNDLIRKKIKNEENQQIADKIIKTADITLQAIEKEHNIEQMIKQEEEQRQENKLKEIENMIEFEEEKKKELNREYIQKELESEILLQTQEHELELKKTQQEASKKLLDSRNKLKNSLIQMRKKFKTKESTLKSKLLKVRNEVANTVSNSYKNGEMERCKEAMTDTELRLAYCKINLTDNPFNYMKCIDENDFCSICCENEFGEMIVEKRKKCITTLCLKHNIIT